ncbi:BEN domain-containing protein 7 [Sarcophilus harrisii]
MEFSERKRSRKSQSFKLVNRDYHHEIYKVSDFSNDVNGEAKETQPIFLVYSGGKKAPSTVYLPEVQLAEGFDVFMPKSQLDSILSNYTRSGSLLFRKLVCAFFDDKTLANSLPNGKRKRGLNDNRKGLDQNIVGAIKVFTEKYCTANHVDKLPGPRDWVQILQDQIKLARRRLKRGSAEVADCDEKLDSISVPPTAQVSCILMKRLMASCLMNLMDYEATLQN